MMRTDLGSDAVHLDGELAARRSIAQACGILDRFGLGDSVWGHVSTRAPENQGIWINRSGLGFGEVDEDDVVLVSFGGDVLGGAAEEGSEFWADLEIMRGRPDVNAVVHAHPIHAVAFAATGWPLKPLSHEGCYFVPPDVPRCDLPGGGLWDREAGTALAMCLGDRNAAFIPHDGIVTAGTDIGEAVALALHLERACQIALLSGKGASGSSDAEALEKRETYVTRMTLSWEYLVRRAESSVRGADPQVDRAGESDAQMDGPEHSIRGDVVTACRVLDNATQGDMVWGHVSIRDPDGRGLWLKGSHLGFEEVVEDDVILLDFDGNVVEGGAGRHVEYPIHTEIMLKRPDVGAIVHTHPLYSVVFAATGWPLLPLSHEGSHFVPPDIERFTLSGDLIRTKELGMKLAEALGDRNAILMPHHGIVTVGTDIGQAVAAATHLDRACQIALLAGREAVPSSDEEALEKRRRSARHLAMAWSYLSRTAK